MKYTPATSQLHAAADAIAVKFCALGNSTKFTKLPGA